MNLTSSEMIVDLQNVNMSFDGYTSILEAINIQLKPGSVTGLLGRNGSGKSTLMRIILGLLKPKTGSVHLFGEPVLVLSAGQRKRIGYVPQSEVPFSWMTFGDALTMVSSFYRNWDHELVQHYVNQWGLKSDAYIEDMSGGEKQKVAIILAIGHKPDLLILDEPIASLDPLARRQFIQSLVEINDDLSKTILFSTHIISDIERIATDVALVNRKGIAFHGSVDDLKESCARLYLSGNSMPKELVETGILRYQVEGNRATAFVCNWNEEKSIALQSKTGLAVVSESLPLEELFLELTDV